MLTGKQILERKRVYASETILVPEWGGSVIVSEMTATQRDAYDRESYRMRESDAGDPNLRARLLVRCLRDEAGAVLFRPDHAAALGLEPPSVLDPLVDVALRLNGLTAKEVDTLAGESAGAPSAALPSGSAGNSGASTPT